MSNTISEGEIVIKDELPEAEPIKALQVPLKIERIDGTKQESKEIVVTIAENKLERFEISTLEQEEVEPIKIHNFRSKKQNPVTIKPEPKVKKEIVVANKKERPVISSQDAKATNFPCDKCGRYLKGEGHLRRHQRIHDEQRIYSCKICGKTFKTPHLLYQHSFVHRKTRNYHCDLCEKRFKTSSNLAQHKLCHVTEKAFACSICCKAFKKKAVMKIHELTHLKPKPEGKFVCSGCGAFLEKSYLLQLHQEKCPKYIKV
jgi:uncharacterized Zn-finger protein